MFDNEAGETNDNDSSFNQLLFFDFKCVQENGTHIPNLCVAHDGQGTISVMSVILFLNICIRMELFQRSLCVGRKRLTIYVPTLNIKFIDSLCFIL